MNKKNKTYYYNNVIIILLLILSFVINSCTKSNDNDKCNNYEQMKIKLMPASKDWGMPIPGSSGELIYKDNNCNYFTGKINLKNLNPKSQYILTINGKPGHPGNDLLLKKYGKQGFMDIYQTQPDSNGNINSESFKVQLDPGQYDVKFFVKDKEQDYKIVLYNDFLFFTIK